MKQLDLFSDQSMGYAAARRDLVSFDLIAAEGALERHLRHYPQDEAARRDLELVLLLKDRVGELPAGDELDGLLGLRELLPDELVPHWHGRLAACAEAAHGAGAYVGGAPAGLHWRLAGEPDKALASLHATLARSALDARARGYLADVLFSCGRLEEARREYLRAFVDGPAEVDCESLADPAVVELLDQASDYAAPGPAATWVAAIGTVERVFSGPPPALPLLQPERATPATSSRPAGIRFFELIVAERAARTLDDRVEIRRRMKEICPELLVAYMRRK
jgi:tetratricopeptide (TPR) repeat protein